MIQLTRIKYVGIAFLAILLTFGIDEINAQEVIQLTNKSFEDVPHKGGSGKRGIKGWFDCGKIYFPDETPPDIHPKDFWDNRKLASDGETYLGMVTRDNDSWESVSQRLSSPMKGGECYSLSIDLSKSAKYISGSRLKGEDGGSVNYSTPLVLRVWGGSGYCNNRELLGESKPVSHSEWKTYSFKLSPKTNLRFITFEAFYKVPAPIPYNGHILVDNASDLTLIPCSEEILAVADEPEKNIPPHKRKRKKPKKKVEQPTKDVAQAPSKPEKPVQTVMNLDRKKITKGQTIEIKNLYFVADTSSINENSHDVLNEVYSFLEQNQDITVEIGGHTNNRPPHKYCDKLSSDRAKAVAQYLVDKGIPAKRLRYKGYGKRKPIASNRTKMGREKNQRVEIKILSIG